MSIPHPNEPKPTLFGMPIVFTDKVPAMKTGDIVLGNMRSYVRYLRMSPEELEKELQDETDLSSSQEQT